MKKILIITLMVICMIFNITACGVKSNNTSKSPLRQRIWQKMSMMP